MTLLPREKLIQFGPESLENAELISVILGHGNKKENVFDLSNRLLKEYGTAPFMYINNVIECKREFNITALQASKLISCFELGKRFFQAKKNKNKIMNSTDIADYYRTMVEFKKEYICGLYLNTRHFIIHDEVLAIGTLENVSLHPRDVFQPAIEKNAYTVVLVHNHPSGDPTPSCDDKYLTNEIKRAGELLRIPLLDHIIIAKNGFYSFHDKEICDTN